MHIFLYFFFFLHRSINTVDCEIIRSALDQCSHPIFSGCYSPPISRRLTKCFCRVNSGVFISAEERKENIPLSFLPVLPHTHTHTPLHLCAHTHTHSLLQNSFNQFEIQALGVITTKVYFQPALI